MKIDGVMEIFDCSQEHAYLITKESGFPTPFKIVGRVKHWQMREVLAWKRRRIDRRIYNGSHK